MDRGECLWKTCLDLEECLLWGDCRFRQWKRRFLMNLSWSSGVFVLPLGLQKILSVFSAGLRYDGICLTKGQRTMRHFASFSSKGQEENTESF